jgi:beta-lactam-binding protein with PASTA domain
MVNIPDVTNKASEVAIDELKKAGLTVSEVRNFDDTVTKGNVIKTSPPAGTQVKANSEVIVYTSLGTNVQPIFVPKLIGMQADAAKTLLEGLKLKCQTVDINSSEPKGTVITQSLPENQQVTEGTLVKLEVSNGIAKTNTLTFSVKIPDNAGSDKQYFTFKVLVDGVLQPALTQVVNTSTQAGKDFKFTLTGSGSNRSVEVRVVPQGSSSPDKLTIFTFTPLLVSFMFQVICRYFAQTRRLA